MSAYNTYSIGSISQSDISGDTSPGGSPETNSPATLRVASFVKSLAEGNLESNPNREIFIDNHEISLDPPSAANNPAAPQKATSIFARIFRGGLSHLVEFSAIKFATFSAYFLSDAAWVKRNILDAIAITHPHAIAGADMIPYNIFGILTGLNFFYGLAAAIRILNEGIKESAEEKLCALVGLVGRSSQSIGGLAFIAERPLAIAATYSKHAVQALTKATNISGVIGTYAFGVYYVFLTFLGIWQLIKNAQSLSILSRIKRGDGYSPEGKIFNENAEKERKILIEATNKIGVEKLEKVAEAHFALQKVFLDSAPEERAIWSARSERAWMRKVKLINELSYTRRIQTIIAISLVVMGMLGIAATIGFFTGGIGLVPLLVFSFAIALLMLGSDGWVMYETFKAHKATESDEKAIKLKIVLAVASLVAAVALTALFTGGLSLAIAMPIAVVAGVAWITYEGYALHKIKQFRREEKDTSLDFFLRAALDKKYSEDQLMEIFSRLTIEEQMKILADENNEIYQPFFSRLAIENQIGDLGRAEEIRYEIFMSLSAERRFEIFEKLTEENKLEFFRTVNESFEYFKELSKTDRIAFLDNLDIRKRYALVALLKNGTAKKINSKNKEWFDKVTANFITDKIAS